MMIESQESANAMLPAIHAGDIIALTARLTELLAEEIEILTEMRIKDLVPLQEEKNMLVEALEMHKRYAIHHPDVSASFTHEELEDLFEVNEVFEMVLKENHQRLLVAKNVNELVRQAISDALNELNPLNSYDLHGLTEAPVGLPPVSLNEKI